MYVFRTTLLFLLLFLIGCGSDSSSQESKPSNRIKIIKPSPTTPKPSFQCSIDALPDANISVTSLTKDEIKTKLGIGISAIQSLIASGTLEVGVDASQLNNFNFERQYLYESTFLTKFNICRNLLCGVEEDLNNPETSNKRKIELTENLDSYRRDLFYAILGQNSSKIIEEVVVDTTVIDTYHIDEILVKTFPCEPENKREILRTCEVRNGDSEENDLLGTLNRGTTVCTINKGNFTDEIELAGRTYFQPWYQVHIDKKEFQNNDRKFWVFGGCLFNYTDTIMTGNCFRVKNPKGAYLRSEPSSKSGNNVEKLSQNTLLINLGAAEQNYYNVNIDSQLFEGVGYWYKVKTDKDTEGWVYQENIIPSDKCQNKISSNNYNVQIEMDNDLENIFIKNSLISDYESSFLSEGGTAHFRLILKRNGKRKVSPIGAVKSEKLNLIAEKIVRNLNFQSFATRTSGDILVKLTKEE